MGSKRLPITCHKAVLINLYVELYLQQDRCGMRADRQRCDAAYWGTQILDRILILDYSDGAFTIITSMLH